ncbi:hypothetical protein GEN90_06560 [Vibrio parahaemolyticus]|nr:hypothetical protein [Vibrio parahaemolyticus]EGR1502835.1 hypothetical protein [Vibrio parahaemolyticus]EGV2730029.1 hypothetical protein [Vibrio parahaemolyticus]
MCLHFKWLVGYLLWSTFRLGADGIQFIKFLVAVVQSGNEMINKAKITLLTLGVVLAGCSSVTAPKKDAIESIQQKCAVILSSDVSDDHRWQVYNELMQEYAVHAIKTQAQLDRFEAFVMRVQSDDSGQLITELIEVTDWGCSNGNYLEEMDMFIQEVQK